MVNDCKFFGTRTEEKRTSATRCIECKKNSPKTFNNCIITSNELMNTSVLLDKDGNTIIKKHEIEPEIEEKPMEETNQTPSADQEKKEVKKTAGVLNFATKLITDGKTDQETLAALIEIYTKSGKSAKQAKHNAQSTLFNAKKKLSKENEGKQQ